MAKRKRRKVNVQKAVRAGGTGFTGKRPKDKPIKIGKGGYAGGVSERAVKI
jgi:hypothetical protein